MNRLCLTLGTLLLAGCAGRPGAPPDSLATFNRAVNAGMTWAPAPSGPGWFPLDPRRGDCERIAIVKAIALEAQGRPARIVVFPLGPDRFHAVVRTGDMVLDNRAPDPIPWPEFRRRYLDPRRGWWSHDVALAARWTATKVYGAGGNDDR